MSYVRRHLATLVDATKAYAEATTSSAKFFIAENECMVKELKEARQRKEQSTRSARAEMKMTILVEVSSLEIVTRRLYDRLITVHKAVVHLHGHQQHCTKIARTLADIHIAVDQVQTWTMRYKGAPLHLHKMMKPHVELDKACIQIQIWNYEELPPLITSIEASYARLQRSLDVMVRMYGTPSIGMFTEAKEKNQVRLELNTYFHQLMLKATSEDFQVSTDNMQIYIVVPFVLMTKLRMLQDELDKGSISVQPEAMEARVCFQKDIIKEYTDTITHYQEWHQFVTKDHREEVDEMVFPQPFESQCCLFWLTQANFFPHGYMQKMYHFCKHDVK